MKLHKNTVTIIFLISLFFDTFLSFKLVGYAFRGIQVCVIYLIFSAGTKMLKQIKKTPISVTIIISVSACMIFFSLAEVKFSTVLYIVICGTVGLFAYIIKTARERRVKK